MSSNIVAGKSVIEIPLESQKMAEILLAALTPETKSGPSDRATTQVSIRDTYNRITSRNELLYCMGFSVYQINRENWLIQTNQNA